MQNEHNEHDERGERDMQIVHSMVQAATVEHLLTEVVLSFGQYMANGDSVEEAAFCALSDWDI